MRTPQWSVLAAVLSLSLAVGCSQGLAPTDEQQDGGVNNHLGDGPSWTGNVQLDSGSSINPGGGGGGGGGGTGSDAGTGGGAGICGTDAATGDATLDACLDSMCCTSFTACYADSACLACLADPSGASCASNSLLLAFDTCWSNNCDTGGGGGGGGGTTGTCCDGGCFGDACDDYINQNCCSSLDACLADSTCSACLTSSSPPATCDSNALLGAFAECVCGGAGATTSCSAECGGSTGGGGTTGNGVCDSGESTGDDTVDACLSTSCCPEFDACFNSASCVDCMYGSGTGCDSNDTYLAFDDCWYNSCG